MHRYTTNRCILDVPDPPRFLQRTLDLVKPCDRLFTGAEASRKIRLPGIGLLGATSQTPECPTYTLQSSNRTFEHTVLFSVQAQIEDTL
eukprot:2820486-Pyramimonas_sp.AAC.2